MIYVAAVPLCPLHAGPGGEKERVDEILMGWPVYGPEEAQGDWWRVRTHYGYSGWVRREQLAPAGEWPLQGKMVVTAPFADILAGPEVERPVLTTLPGQSGRCHRGSCSGGLAADRTARWTERLYKR